MRCTFHKLNPCGASWRRLLGGAASLVPPSFTCRLCGERLPLDDYACESVFRLLDFALCVGCDVDLNHADENIEDSPIADGYRLFRYRCMFDSVRNERAGYAFPHWVTVDKVGTFWDGFFFLELLSIYDDAASVLLATLAPYGCVDVELVGPHRVAATTTTATRHASGGDTGC